VEIFFKKKIVDYLFSKINKVGLVTVWVFSTQNSRHIIFNLNIRLLKLKLEYGIILKIKNEKFNKNLIKL